MTTYLDWLPAALQARGIPVRLYAGWNNRNHGPLAQPIYVTWHHDASPRGDSPGVPESMIRRWNIAAAPIWVDRYGTWHIIGNGKAWHAGRVLAGKPSNTNSVGIETDHTTGEDWPPALLDSLRLGTAVIFEHENRNADALEFHKTVCRPPGRKVDPDGLDLATERRNVAAIMSGAPITLPPVYAPVRPIGPRTLGNGDEGEDVRHLQEQLLALGYPLPRFGADGDFGDETETAVEALQAAAGIAVDGLVGEDTRAAIARGVRPSKPAPPVAAKRYIGYGFPLPHGHWFGTESSDGRNHSGYWAADRPHIVALLNGLRARGWRGVPATDRYTGAVEALVYRYQSDARISVDGAVGPVTWESIRTSPVR